MTDNAEADRRQTSWWRHAALTPRPVVLGVCLALVIALVTVLGVLHFSADPGTWLASDLFHLDKERTVVAAVSGLILLWASWLCFLVRPPTNRWRAMGVILGFMALDEVFAIHEHSEKLTGIFWQFLYVPVGVVAVWAWIACLLRMTKTSARVLWVVGAGAWAISQVLEYVQWNVFQDLQEDLVLWEEPLEMIGSSCWLLAVVVLVRAGANLVGTHRRETARPDATSR